MSVLSINLFFDLEFSSIHFFELLSKINIRLYSHSPDGLMFPEEKKGLLMDKCNMFFSNKSEYQISFNAEWEGDIFCFLTLVRAKNAYLVIIYPPAIVKYELDGFYSNIFNITQDMKFFIAMISDNDTFNNDYDVEDLVDLYMGTPRSFELVVFARPPGWKFNPQ